MAKGEEIELTKKILKNIKYEEVIALKIAEAGAMGEPNGLEIIQKDLTVYHVNLAKTRIRTKLFAEKLPILATFKCFFGKTNTLEGWKTLYMGYGNNFLLREEYYEDYKKYVDNNFEGNGEGVELYTKWYEVLKEIVK